MNIDYITCTKYLYFAEKLLTDNNSSSTNDGSEVYCKLDNEGNSNSESIARFVEMTEKEVDHFYKEFKKEGLIYKGMFSPKLIAQDGSYDSGIVWLHADLINREGFLDFIKNTQKTYALREKPLLTREKISIISSELEEIFEKDSIVKIIKTFSKSDRMIQLYKEGGLSLTDILFRLSYSRESLTPLTYALAEFLNPKYYQSAFEGARKSMFLHIDKIVKPIFNIKHYQDWLNESLKYVEIDNGRKIALSLKDRKVEFDDAKPAIVVDGKSCPLPPAKNEDYLARALFRRPVGEYVDWSTIYGENTGSKEVIGDKNDMKSVRDTMNRLNKRIKEIIGTKDDLLSWENKSIKRNY